MSSTASHRAPRISLQDRLWLRRQALGLGAALGLGLAGVGALAQSAQPSPEPTPPAPSADKTAPAAPAPTAEAGAAAPESPLIQAMIAAEAGGPEEKLRLAMMYAEGVGAPHNDSMAWAWLKQITGDGPVVAEAHYQLGMFYLEGRGIPNNSQKAIDFFTLAANQGHVGAYTELGRAYLNGTFYKRNSYQALRWFSKAALRNGAAAQAELDKMLKKGDISVEEMITVGDGLTIPKKTDLAERWQPLRKAVLDGLRPYRSADNENFELGLHSDPVFLETEDGKLQVVFPLVRVRLGDSSGIDFGTIRMTVTPRDEKSYTFQIQLPVAVGIYPNTRVEPVYATMDHASLSGVWDNLAETAPDFSLAVSGFKINVPQYRNAERDIPPTRFEIGDLAMALNSTETTPGVWDSKLTSTLSRVRTMVWSSDPNALAGREPKPLLSLGEIKVGSTAVGERVGAYEDIRNKLGFDAKTGTWNRDAMAPAEDLPEVLPPMFDTYEASVALSDLKVDRPEADISFAMPRIAQGVNITDSDNGMASVSLAQSQDSVDLGEMTPIERMTVPTAVNSAITFDHLATAELRRIGAEILRSAVTKMIETGSGEFGEVASLEFTNRLGDISETILNAQPEMQIHTFEIRTDVLSFRLQGYLQGDDTAVRKMAGSFTASVRGINTVLEDPELFEALGDGGAQFQLMDALGEDAEDEDGRKLKVFRIDITPEGPIYLNDKPIEEALANNPL